MIVHKPGKYYEIEALEERPKKWMPKIGPLPPPIPTVFHCRCNKWWVITDHLYGTPLCPACDGAMSAWIDFQESDYRYGNYGKAEQYDIKKI
tara:strand:+ start:197 stop:472 length:276 start_codon:yes stop_codon:yes gene_type:complete